jgi:hypothetical protein
MKPTGGGTTVTPIPPPTSLFPSVTSGVQGSGGWELGNDLQNSLQGITSGANLNQLFQAISQSNQQSLTQGTAALKESFAASGMGGSTNMAQSITNYRQQTQAQQASQFAQLGLQNEELELGGDQIISNLATSFAPSVAVGQAPSGSSPFSQASSAGEAAMMGYLMYAAAAAA